MRALVLDLSHWDGQMDLAAWKRDRGLWGVIIKAGGNERNLGRYRDSMFESHYQAAKNAGLHIGFYYYTVTTDVRNAITDANHFCDLIAGKDADLPCYMDVEDPGQFQLSARALTDVIINFCDTVNNRGRYGGLYTGGSAWLNNMYHTELLKYADWIAWWRANWPTEAGNIGMWQQGGMRYSDGHVVYDDVSGYHDCNWCAIDYPSIINGTAGAATNNAPVTPSTEPASTKGTAKGVIDAAYGELGYYAPNDPERGSKYGRWMAQITGQDWLAGPSTEIWWCCMFASWCLDQGGVKMDGFPTQNTDLALNGGARKYAVDKYDVQYGDVIIFNWDWDSATDHIGFATGSFDGNGFTTIEGNIGNAVKESYRQMGNVAYVLRPPYTGGGSSDYTPGVSTNAKNNRDGGSLDVDGIGGWNTIIDWQHQLGTYEDGWISGQIENDKPYHGGMCNVTYEHTGSQLVKAIQNKVGVTVDGYWGSVTSKAIQQWLIDKGYSLGDCGVDGNFGNHSVMALQQSLNDKAWK